MKFLLKNAIKTALPDIIKKVAITADKIVLGGAVSNVTEDTAESPKGKLDVVKLIKTIGYTSIPILLLIALFAGWIDMEELKELIKLF